MPKTYDKLCDEIRNYDNIKVSFGRLGWFMLNEHATSVLESGGVLNIRIGGHEHNINTFTAI